jgi:hypothetical protein
MELELLNKLFLELSQIVTAKTAREIELERLNNQLINEINIYRVKYGLLGGKATLPAIDFDWRSDET